MSKETRVYRRRWSKSRLYQRSSSRWTRVVVICCLILGVFHWVSIFRTHRKALLDKFSPTIFTHLTTRDKDALASTSWRWDQLPADRVVETSSYSRSDIWASRHDWRPLGSGSEGEAFVYNGTVIKVYKTKRFPFRNCVPEARPELRWPTEITASLLLGGMVDDEDVGIDANFLPVTDYFLSPPTEYTPPRWHFLTPFLPSGNLVKLAAHLRRSEHAYSADDLDVLYRPSLERLLEALDQMHNQHELCHDDVKPDNIFLSGGKSLTEPGATLDATKKWILADLGNVREPGHAYHSSILWSRLNNNIPDCRVNDVSRLLKSYMVFLRTAVDDAAAFDVQFFSGHEPWARLYWSLVDAIDEKKFVSATSTQQLSKQFGPSQQQYEDTAAWNRDPPGVRNPVTRLLLSREQVVVQGVTNALKISAADSAARNWGMTLLFGVPVENCQSE
ncbi:hypothetical protein FZEAL_1176 [Fusarium zealandicum]|uniref:Protein kinase domain-containing protein n=1 Tax=Fusarium zealandicum TaxID=1053134 RepID=A0A8H4UU60_9HYPO|nr:hypothetical protein FZEAL_1176 [Fusarium zealandicum]